MKGEKEKMKRKFVVGALCLASIMGISVCAEGNLTEKDSVSISGTMDLGFNLLADDMSLGLKAQGNAVADLKKKDDGIYIRCNAGFEVFMAGQSDTVEVGYYIVPDGDGYIMYEGNDDTGTMEWTKSEVPSDDVEAYWFALKSIEDSSDMQKDMESLGFTVTNTGDGVEASLNKTLTDLIAMTGSDMSEMIPDELSQETADAINVDFNLSMNKDWLPTNCKLDFGGSDLSKIDYNGYSMEINKGELKADFSYDSVDDIVVPEDVVNSASLKTDIGQEIDTGEDETENLVEKITESELETEDGWQYEMDHVLTVGEDINPGSYMLTSTDGLGYMTLENNGEIVCSELFEKNFFVDLVDGDVLKLDSAIYSNVTDDLEVTGTGEGMYRVGKDIPSGIIKLEIDGTADSGYWCLYSDARGTISDNGFFDGSTEITAVDGEYLMLSDSKLAE